MGAPIDQWLALAYGRDQIPNCLLLASVLIRAISIIIATTIDNAILVLYTRNPTAAYRSIY